MHKQEKVMATYMNVVEAIDAEKLNVVYEHGLVDELCYELGLTEREVGELNERKGVEKTKYLLEDMVMRACERYNKLPYGCDRVQDSLMFGRCVNALVTAGQYRVVLALHAAFQEAGVKSYVLDMFVCDKKMKRQHTSEGFHAKINGNQE